ncbi:hypothetical protein [Succinimonas sp.]|uniref:hypothetical protein n=1 Tax=Succinimonas sp. TaxID=1936151 RepID=UPI00386683C7
MKTSIPDNLTEKLRCPYCSGELSYIISREKLACILCGMKLSPEEYETAVAAKTRRERSSSSFSSGVFSAAASPSSSSFQSSSSAPSPNPKAREAERRSAAGTPDYVPCANCRLLVGRGVGELLGACPVCHKNIAGAERSAGANPAENAGFGAPDLIVPFSKDGEFFIQEFRKHLRSLEFVPDSFLEAGIESVRAFYVPVLLYDAEVSGEMSLHGTLVTELYKPQDHYLIEEFEIAAGGSQLYCGSPENLTREISDYAFRNLEPFDSRGARCWSRGYAAIPDLTVPAITRSDYFGRTKLRFMTGFEYFLAEGDSFTSFRAVKKQVSLVPLKVSYAWLPVWQMEIRQGGKKMLCHMNGQTGKLMADIPVSAVKMLCWLLSGLLLLTGLAAWLVAPYYMPVLQIPLSIILGALSMAVLMFLYSVIAPVRRLFAGRKSSRITGSLMAAIGLAFIMAAYCGTPEYHGRTFMFIVAMLAGGVCVICYRHSGIIRRMARQPGGTPRNEGIPYLAKADLRYRNRQKTSEREDCSAGTFFKPVE